MYIYKQIREKKPIVVSHVLYSSIFVLYLFSSFLRQYYSALYWFPCGHLYIKVWAHSHLTSLFPILYFSNLPLPWEFNTRTSAPFMKWIILNVVIFQIVGDWSHCPAVSPRSHLGLWSDVRQREHRGHGLPVHHLQLTARHVHLHLPLRPAEKGIADILLFKTKALHPHWGKWQGAQLAF